MKAKTYLFFVMEVGLAHIVRSLSVAEDLKALGHTVIFALPKRKQSLVKHTTVHLIDIPGYAEHDSIEVTEAFNKKDILITAVRAELALINTYKPDAIIVDNRATAIFSALLLRKKIFTLAGAHAVPADVYIPRNALLHSSMIAHGVEKVARTFIRTIVKTVLKNLKSIATVPLRDFLYKPVYLIPEFKNLFPFEDTRIRSHYITIRPWTGFKQNIPTWLKKIKPDGNTIYLTFGGTGFDGDKLIGICSQLLNQGYRVIVSTGHHAEIDQFPTHKNLFIDTYLPGGEISKRVDLVVCHGGHGTLMDAIMHGKPVVAVPFNPDQFLQSTRIAELKMGRYVSTFTMIDLIDVFRLKWSSFEKVGKRVKAHDVVCAVNKVFDQYDEHTKSIDRFIKENKTAEYAAQVIDRLT